MAAPKVTVKALADHVNADETADREFLGECIQEAADLVDDLITRNASRPVPDSIAKRAEKEAGADLYFQRRTRNGIALFGSGGDDLGGVEPVRVSRDPLVTARSILRPYLGAAVA
ncbi:hypothetical protein [Arthrobacter woluwensis]|uniref:hypothetical protein n=1 Tax=Arthrobacter woluwensis TaxID=156980 RepID=UPI001AAEFB2E|nr:hypothetical protein [Arthrobacter woluwensis]QTF71761.1 hypothetical protein G8758_06910 [Arthrobacter woluwensis]